MKKVRSKIIVVCGPTAVGKSALAVRLARRFGGEVISADSRQVYRGLNIGTGKITKREMRGVPHHMLDVANPKHRYVAAEFQKAAREKICEIFSRGRIPVVCGGSGFYISALVDGVNFPNVPPNKKLRAKLEKKPAEELFKMLKKLDPRRASEIDPKNKRRLARAIEIATTLGKVPLLDIRCPNCWTSDVQQSLWIGLTLHPEELRERIHIRLFSRISRGMISEVKKLRENGLSWKRMEELGLEYRYLARYLTNKITKDEMVRRLETEIWRYAKRQMTWFRRDKRIKWFSPDEYKKIENEVKKFLTGDIRYL
jgi:tRNA dimethylallyltransferase